MSHGAEFSADHVARTFESIGIRSTIASALYKAFPTIRQPTDTQAQLIPVVMSGGDILLKDDTGTGKSFGLILALLNKARRRFRVPSTGELDPNPAITSLFLVPHRDLAYQLLYWIEKLAIAHKAQASSLHLNAVAQVLVRDAGKHLTSGIEALKRDAPHILIATPQAAMDVWQQDPGVLQLSKLSAVVVDEIDYLIDTVPIRPTSRTRSKIKVRYLQNKITKHPGLTRELLEIIYGSRDHQESPQLILSSATLSLHLTEFLEGSGWLDPTRLVKIRGSSATVRAPSDVQGQGKPVPSLRSISHSVLVVSDNSVRNISAAKDEKDSTAPANLEKHFTGAAEVTVDPKLVEKYGHTPSPYSPSTLEAIATAFALDVPSTALLAIPSSASVSRAVFDLRCLGVNAHGLNLLYESKGREYLLRNDAGQTSSNPALLVCTPATVRGLDLPELTHVFILGIPDGASGGKLNNDTYMHLAGRVGRFGRKGKVITVIEQDEDRIGSKWESKDASRVLNILKRMSVAPIRLSLFP